MEIFFITIEISILPTLLPFHFPTLLAFKNSFYHSLSHSPVHVPLITTRQWLCTPNPGTTWFCALPLSYPFMGVCIWWLNVVVCTCLCVCVTFNIPTCLWNTKNSRCDSLEGKLHAVSIWWKTPNKQLNTRHKCAYNQERVKRELRAFFVSPLFGQLSHSGSVK